MKVQINQETLNAMKSVIEANSEQPDNIRIYIAGMGWSGPSFGLTLDEFNKEEDLIDESNEIKFLMSKDVYNTVGDMLIELSNGGYIVRPVNATDSGGCSSCSGC